MAKKLKNDDRIGRHPIRIKCFKCHNKNVIPGKKCQKCGARALIGHTRDHKNRIKDIRLTELTNEER